MRIITAITLVARLTQAFAAGGMVFTSATKHVRPDHPRLAGTF